MKLGRDTASLINHVYAAATAGQPDPEVGMGATILSWTDRYAGTVILVDRTASGGWRVAVQYDRSVVQPGTGGTGNEVYTYERDPAGRVAHFEYRRGRWVEVTLNRETGRWNSTRGHGLVLGRRDSYRDPSF